MDIFEKMRNEDYQEYLEDVDIAIAELKSMKFYPVEGTIICDLYAIPSHNYQSYYAVIFESNGRYDMLYAKPQLFDPIVPGPIKMYRFKKAKEAENHTVKNGKIIMGMKHLSDEFVSTIKDILGAFPSVKSIDTDGYMLDGYFQAIRVYKNNTIDGEVVFCRIESLLLPKGKEYLSNVLDELYVSVGEIIE